MSGEMQSLLSGEWPLGPHPPPVDNRLGRRGLPVGDRLRGPPDPAQPGSATNAADLESSGSAMESAGSAIPVPLQCHNAFKVSWANSLVDWIGQCLQCKRYCQGVHGMKSHFEWPVADDERGTKRSAGQMEAEPEEPGERCLVFHHDEDGDHLVSCTSCDPLVRGVMDWTDVHKHLIWDHSAWIAEEHRAPGSGSTLGASSWEYCSHQAQAELMDAWAAGRAPELPDAREAEPLPHAREAEPLMNAREAEPLMHDAREAEPLPEEWERELEQLLSDDPHRSSAMLEFGGGGGSDADSEAESEDPMVDE